MVSYNVGDSDPNSLPLGTYYIKRKTPSRGKNAGITELTTYQVKKKGKDGEHYWSRASRTRRGGMPLPSSARLLGLVPSEEAISQYDNGKVHLYAAFDHNGENPSSIFLLKRRKDGDGYHYYWSPVTEVKAPRQRTTTTVRKPRAKRTQVRSLAGALSE
jgi:hypothetical protein